MTIIGLLVLAFYFYILIDTAKTVSKQLDERR